MYFMGYFINLLTFIYIEELWAAIHCLKMNDNGKKYLGVKGLSDVEI